MTHPFSPLVLMWGIFIFILTGCSATATPMATPAPATDTPEVKIAVTGVDEPFRLVTGEYPPFTGESLPEGGMATEIVTTVFKDLGWKYEIAFEPWDRGLANLDAGKYFGTFPYHQDDERSKYYLFSDPVISNDLVFYGMKDSTFNYTQPDDLTGHIICYPGGEGWSLEGLQPYFDAGKIKMERPTTMVACFNMLQAKRVEMVFAAESVGWPAAKQALGSSDDVKILDKHFAGSTACLMISKNYPDGEKLLNAFNYALKKLEEDGTLAKIRARHTSQ
jgi:polar amino acid transport system substrate-binding protein